MIASHLQAGDAAGRQTIAAMQAAFVRQRDQLKPLLAGVPAGASSGARRTRC